MRTKRLNAAYRLRLLRQSRYPRIFGATVPVINDLKNVLNAAAAGRFDICDEIKFPRIDRLFGVILTRFVRATLFPTCDYACVAIVVRRRRC